MASRDTITDYDIQALVDNELPWEREKEIFSFFEYNRPAAQRYKELCAQKEFLKRWYKKSSL
ncbi:MAG: hypothetical protein K9G62_06430 [Alphaproteobacteria bacterium]|nr:hypothetical protein [Alphaproteobacteria bacterium]